MSPTGRSCVRKPRANGAMPQVESTGRPVRTRRPKACTVPSRMRTQKRCRGASLHDRAPEVWRDDELLSAARTPAASEHASSPQGSGARRTDAAALTCKDFVPLQDGGWYAKRFRPSRAAAVGKSSDRRLEWSAYARSGSPPCSRCHPSASAPPSRCSPPRCRR